MSRILSGLKTPARACRNHGYLTLAAKYHLPSRRVTTSINEKRQSEKRQKEDHMWSLGLRTILFSTSIITSVIVYAELQNPLYINSSRGEAYSHSD
jgi:hypothetical protein